MNEKKKLYRFWLTGMAYAMVITRTHNNRPDILRRADEYIWRQLMIEADEC